VRSMNTKQKFLGKIADRELKIGIIGLGYVGLPLAVAFAEAGFPVFGIDVNETKIDLLARGESYVQDVPGSKVKGIVDSGMFTPSSDYANIAYSDAVLICVPTPLSKTRDPDISYIVDAVSRLAQYDLVGKLIVLESTTYPGTTEEIILSQLSENGYRVGEDFFLSFSPERVDPGRMDYNLYTTPKVLGGVTKSCTEVAAALYSIIVKDVVTVSSTAAAEMVKLLENTFRAVNIGLVNEVAIMCDKLGLDVWEIIEAASTKPYGFMPFYPGPGLGGHCIPIDPQYLSWKLRGLNYKARFIELADQVNSFMPDYIVEKIVNGLNQRRKPVKDSKILVLGVTYKPDVNDVRESPALDIIQLLINCGAVVRFHDPYVNEIAVSNQVFHTVDLNEDVLGETDCIVIVADHASYDWQWIARHADLIVDTRNALKNIETGNVIKL
jgi:UDP-N-acetyl-D-glucosamine dehydrogenase